MELDVDVQAKLYQLPPKLEQLYTDIYEERIMSYPGEAGQAILSNALKWLLCAQRPLKSSEFCIAVAMNLPVLSQNLTTENILDLCNNFVVLDNELDTLRFAYLSVREFLEKRPEYSQNSCHILAAEICLLQLTGSSRSSAAESFLGRECPFCNSGRLAPTAETIIGGFHKYATCFWMKHCQTSEEDKRTGFHFAKLFQFFLFDDSGTDSLLSTWMLSYRRTRGSYGVYGIREKLESCAVSSVRCHFLASALGFCEILRHFPGKQELTTLEKQTSLSLAAENRQDEAFKLVLSSEGDVASPEKLIDQALRRLTHTTLKWFLDRSPNI